MKIAITGTKGIPNRYGGFEQLAEYLSIGLAKRGHDVIVYNPHYYPFKNPEYKGVKIIYKLNPENILGPAANIIYDFLCIRNAVKNKVDIVLECGYASAIPALRITRKHSSRIIVHLDGIEWKRSKWNWMARTFIKYAERRILSLSKYLICDHIGIHDYYHDKYSVSPYCIRYGARTFKAPETSRLDQYLLEPYKYYLAIARLEPENNIEEIIRGYLDSGDPHVLIIIGRNNSRHGKTMLAKYGNHPKIWLKEGNYNHRTLDSLRHFARAYFHGHSVGGSNPSLLEAMASGAFIIAHDNIYNKTILGEDACYFGSRKDIVDLLKSLDHHLEQKESNTEANLKKIREKYRWDGIVNEYEELFRKVISGEEI